MQQFLVDYSIAIDVLALLALAGLAIAAVVRKGTPAMGLLAIVALFWVGSRLFALI